MDKNYSASGDKIQHRHTSRGNPALIDTHSLISGGSSRVSNCRKGLDINYTIDTIFCFTICLFFWFVFDVIERLLH